MVKKAEEKVPGGSPADRPFAVFDLDGTLACCKHRHHHIAAKPKRYDRFYAECGKDSPLPAINLLRSLYDQGWWCEIWTGRSAEVRAETEEWLALQRVPHHLLVMRPAKDHTPDHILKGEWLATCARKPSMVFEDRSRVVNMWRAAGVLSSSAGGLLVDRKNMYPPDGGLREPVRGFEETFGGFNMLRRALREPAAPARLPEEATLAQRVDYNLRRLRSHHGDVSVELEVSVGRYSGQLYNPDGPRAAKLIEDLAEVIVVRDLLLAPPPYRAPLWMRGLAVAGALALPAGAILLLLG